MSFQTVRTDYWEARLPEAWARVPREPKEVIYFESPDHAAGVYFSTWRVTDQPLLSALHDTRAVEQRNLPGGQSKRWEILRQSETVNGPDVEALTEYLNREDNYRIISRLLGRGQEFVRLSYHDYNCTDVAVSSEQSASLLASLALINNHLP